MEIFYKIYYEVWVIFLFALMLFMLMILFQSCTATLKKMNLSLIERRLRKLCFHKVRPCWKRVFCLYCTEGNDKER